MDKCRYGLVLVCFAIVVSVLVGAASATTWYVDDDGGAGMDFTKIQDAINAALPGDTIEVRSGTYYENVNMDKQLILRGIDTGAGKPVVDADGNESAITISADGCVIDRFNVTGSGSDWGKVGIKIGSENNKIVNNTCSHNHNGIFFDGHSGGHSSYNNTVTNNTVCYNNEAGIYVYRSHYNMITNNVVSSNMDDGIILEHSSYNLLSNNVANSNKDVGIEVDESDNNRICNNTISLNNGDGISMDYTSDNNIICNNTILRNTGDGIGMGHYSSNNRIINNKIVFNNDDGIGFSGHTSCNLIANNNISFNDDDGIVLKTSQYNTIRSNTITSNDEMGIKLDSAPNNIIYHNNLMDNCPNGYDDTGANNSWDNGPIIGGNYWSDHTCDGNPSNGRQPYHIDKYGVDNYPFEEPIGDAPPLPPLYLIGTENSFIGREHNEVRIYNVELEAHYVI